MKIIKAFMILVIGISVISCDKIFRIGDDSWKDNGEGVRYSISFCFTDNLGNCVSNGIALSNWSPENGTMLQAKWGEVNRDSCKVFYSTPENKNKKIFEQRFIMNKTEFGDWLLCSNIWGSLNNNYNPTIFQITCPYIFHDKDVHEFVVHWAVPQESITINEGSGTSVLHFAKCIMLTVDGNEIDSTVYTRYPNSKQGELTNIVTIDTSLLGR